MDKETVKIPLKNNSTVICPEFIKGYLRYKTFFCNKVALNL